MKIFHQWIILSLSLAIYSYYTPIANAANETMVGQISGTFSTDASGAASYIIPIECPIGINGIQPNLSLVYNSSSNNGIAGWGWNISGLSSIMRTAKTTYYDGKNQNIAWNNTDSLIFNGQRMMTFKKWNQDSIEYRLETDPTTMIRAYNIQDWGASYFKVFTKDGIIATYGNPQTQSSYILMYTDAQTGSNPIKAGWNLVELRDRNGNFMKIDYITSSGSYKGNTISKITYGGNTQKGTVGNLIISFVYENRPDEIQSFISGKEYLQQLRLTKIQSTVNSTIQKEYRLSYTNETISRLASIELYNRGIKQFEPLFFNYGQPSTVETNVDISFIRKDEYNNEKEKRGLIAVDLDGDGYNEFGDIYYRDESGSIIEGLSRCYFDIHKKSQNWVATQRFPVAFDMEMTGFSVQNHVQELFADFNGNGSAESLFAYFEGNPNKGAFLNIRITDRSKDSILCNEMLNETTHRPFIATGNYLGRPLANALIIYDDPHSCEGGYSYRYDMIMSGINGEVLSYKGDLFLTVPAKIQYATTAKLGSASYRDDIWLILEDGTTRILKNNQATIACFSGSEVINTLLNIGKNDLQTFGDINNDGLLDVIFRKSYNDWEIGLNRGDGTFTIKPLTIICGKDGHKDENDAVFLTDFNNDGLLDIVTGNEQGVNGTFFSTAWSFYINKGNGSFYVWRTASNKEKSSYSCLADILGKGTINWIHANEEGKVVITDFGFGKHINLLTKITGPLSPALELKYKPLAECRVRDGEKDDINKCNSYKDYLSIGYLPFKTTMKPIISESYDGRNRISYDYGTALINWGHRGYMGFRYQKNYNATNKQRTEIVSKIFTSSGRYNVILPVTTTQYIGMTSTYYDFLEGHSYSLKPLGGNRFTLQQYSSSQNNRISNQSYSEDYAYDNYNNVTHYKKKTVGLTIVNKQLEYSTYGTWCPSSLTSETITETALNGDALTKTNRYLYDNRGNLIQQIMDYGDVNAVTIQMTNYNNFGYPTTISRTANGQTRTSSTTHSASGRFVTKEVNELGESVSQEWDENRELPLKKTDRIGTTTYTYDNFGSLIQTTYPDKTIKNQQLAWNSVIPCPVPEGKYATTSELSGKAPITTWYDEYGQEVVQKTIGFNSKPIYTHKMYDINGKLIGISKPTSDSQPGDNWEAFYDYDAYGRVTNAYTSKGDITTEYTLGVDYEGYTCAVKTVTTPNSRTETMWDEIGVMRQSSVNGKTVFFSHTVGSKVKTATPENGNTVSYQYDRNGNRTQISDPNTSTIDSEYDAWGQLVKETQSIHKSGNATIVTYSYSPTGLLQKKTQGNVVTNYVYDVYNRLTRVYTTNNNNAEKTYTYDNYDRIIQVTNYINDQNNYKTSYTSKKEYDIYGHITKETYPSGYYINNIYDNYGNLISVTDKASRKIWELVDCDPEGHVTQDKKGDILTTYTYKEDGQITSIVSPNIVNMHYLYNLINYNLESYEDKISGQKEYYEYDDMDRLSKWNIGEINYNNDNTIYDSKGRISYRVDVLESERNYHYDDPVAYNALTSFDYYGTLVDRNISYTNFKKVSTIEGSDMRHDIKYGVDQERVYSFQAGRSVPVIYRFYAENFEEDYTPTGFSKVHYIYGGNGLAAIYKQNRESEEFFRTFTDRQGSLVALTNTNGNVVERYAYDPWGNRRNPSNWREKDSRINLITSRGYTMHEHLDQFGLINMNSRMYEPRSGMFLSPDPQLQDPENWLNYNRYTYCLNNPLKYTDPNGEFFWTVINAVKDFFVNTFIKSWSQGINAWSSSENWHSTAMAWKIDVGLFKGGPLQILSRFTWELPQTLIGYQSSHFLNLFNNVRSVSYFGGATAVESYSKDWGAFTSGSYILGARGLTADPNNSLFQHEYGHYLQSQSMGWGYLSRVGIPSLFDAGGSGKHKYHPIEQDANLRAFKYFNEHVEGFYQTSEEYFRNRTNKIQKGWDFRSNPLDPSKTDSWRYWDYNNSSDMNTLNNLKIGSSFLDYLGSGGVGIIGVGTYNYYQYK